MQEFTSTDFFWLICAGLTATFCLFIICVKHPSNVAMIFMAILFLFPASTWGQLEIENTIYSRGTGLFYFSLLNWCLWISAVTLLAVHSHTSAPGKLKSPIEGFLYSYIFLMLAHITIGLMADQDIFYILGYNGFINVINMLIFGLIIISAISTQREQYRFLCMLLMLAVIRGIYGLVRYLWLEGDPSNPYRNFENLDIKIFYFDIADNFIAAFAAFCIAWLLWMSDHKFSLTKKCLLYSLLLLEIAAVVLSFRRSSLLGMVLMFGILLWRLPWQRQVQLALAGTITLFIAGLTVMQQRLQFSSEQSNWLTSLFYDIGPNHTTEVSRLYELEAAAHSLHGNWLFGLGSWGSFYGNEDILDYHFGQFDFVHSGLGHLLLKTGVIGLILFFALLCAFFWRYFKNRSNLSGMHALFADAGIAGLFFWLPTLCIGTPIIEFRTMLLMGFTLALPFLAPYRKNMMQPSCRTHYAIA